MYERLDRLIKNKIEELNRWADTYAEDKQNRFMEACAHHNRGRIYQIMTDIHDMMMCRDMGRDR